MLGIIRNRVLTLAPAVAAVLFAFAVVIPDASGDAPKVDVTIEPFELGAVVYGPLAARTSGDTPNGQLSLVLRIKNNELTAVHVNTVTISFTPPPMVSVATIPADLSIDASKTATLYFPATYNVILPESAPSALTVGILCDNFTTLAIFTQPLGSYQGDGSGYFFPGKLSELRPGEFWQGQSAVHAPAGGGVQLFAYDMAVVGYDPAANAGSECLPGVVCKPCSAAGCMPGENPNLKNEDYRIWGIPVRAMADGVIQSWRNDIVTNPKPGADLSPPNPVEGNHFYIQHGNDLVLYAHMQAGSLTASLMTQNGMPSPACMPGACAAVKAGDLLGLAGNSGNSSNPHLHIHAIKGTVPWQGPPRPILFRDINVLDRAKLNLPDLSGPWVKVKNQGLPSVKAAIWPSPTPPFHLPSPPYYATIDPLALILSSEAYVRLTLPDPPPIDVWTRQVREVVARMTPQEREAALKRVRALGGQLKVLEQQLQH